MGEVDSKFKHVWMRLVKLYALTISSGVLFACHDSFLWKDLADNKLNLIGIAVGTAMYTTINVLSPIAAGDIDSPMLNKLLTLMLFVVTTVIVMQCLSCLEGGLEFYSKMTESLSIQDVKDFSVTGMNLHSLVEYSNLMLGQLIIADYGSSLLGAVIGIFISFSITDVVNNASR